MCVKSSELLLSWSEGHDLVGTLSISLKYRLSKVIELAAESDRLVLHLNCYKMLRKLNRMQNT